MLGSEVCLYILKAFRALKLCSILLLKYTAFRTMKNLFNFTIGMKRVHTFRQISMKVMCIF